MNRRPHPTEPDVADARHEVAEAIYNDALGYLRDGQRIPPVLSALLYWFGYRAWLLPNNGFTPPETLRRRTKLFKDLKALARPWEAEAVRLVEELGWARPPDREAVPKFEHLDRYCEVDGKTIRWGLRNTLERDVIFHARYDMLRLCVVDGGEMLHEITRRPRKDGWEFTETFEALGLADDDYRFELFCFHSGTGTRSRHPFDYAEVDGEWRRLEYQGYDWDGEFRG